MWPAWTDSMCNSLVPPGYSPASPCSGPSQYCPLAWKWSSASYNTGEWNTFSAPPTKGSRWGSCPGSFPSGTGLWKPSVEPSAALSLTWAQSLVLFLSLSTHNCWLQTTCSRSSGQYFVNLAPAVCTSWEKKEIDEDAVKASQGRKKQPHRLTEDCPSVLSHSWRHHLPCLLPSLSHFPPSPFPSYPFWFFTSSNSNHNWEELGNILSGSPSLKALLCFQKTFPLVSQGFFIANFRTLWRCCYPTPGVSPETSRTLSDYPSQTHLDRTFWASRTSSASSMACRGPTWGGSIRVPTGRRTKGQVCTIAFRVSTRLPWKASRKSGGKSSMGRLSRVEKSKSLSLSRRNESAWGVDTHRDSAPKWLLLTLSGSKGSILDNTGAHIRISPYSSKDSTQGQGHLSSSSTKEALKCIHRREMILFENPAYHPETQASLQH